MWLSNRFKRSLAIIILSFAVSAIFMIGLVFAGGGGGGPGGVGGGGSSDGCGLNSQYLTAVCNDYPNVGGVAWRMYSVDSLMNKTSYEYPVKKEYDNVTDGYPGYDVTVKDILKNCSKKDQNQKETGYYFALVYVAGPDGYHDAGFLKGDLEYIVYNGNNPTDQTGKFSYNNYGYPYPNISRDTGGNLYIVSDGRPFPYARYYANIIDSNTLKCNQNDLNCIENALKGVYDSGKKETVKVNVYSWSNLQTPHLKNQTINGGRVRIYLNDVLAKKIYLTWGPKDINYDDAGWFCVGGSNANFMPYSQSQASIGNSMAETNIVNTATTVYANDIETVPLGSKIRVSFKHRVYGNESKNNVPWTINKNFSWNPGGDYAIVSENTNNGGTVNVNKAVSNLGDVKYEAGSNPVSQNSYTIQFLKAGTYTFCEKISVEGKELSQACVRIEVKAPTIPEDCKKFISEMPSGEEAKTYAISLVRNATIGTDWKNSNGVSEEAFKNNSVYAAPNQDIEWAHCYFAGVQLVSNTTVSYSGKTGAAKDVIKPWENHYVVQQENMTDKQSFASPSLGAGNLVAQVQKNEYKVLSRQYSRAGLSLTESITSGKPKSVEIANGNARVDEGPAFDKVMVKVPYNFTNTAEVKLSNSVVYAGEKSASIETFKVVVGKKYNSETRDEYATKVDGAEVQLIAYTAMNGNGNEDGNYKGDNPCDKFGGGCQKIKEYSGSLNSPEIIDGRTYNDTIDEVGFTGSYGVFDVPAGSYYCVAAAVYPANSGNDTNMDPNGSDSWYISKPSCVRVAKKPSIQVWGAGMYTNDNVVLQVANKTNVAGSSFNAGDITKSEIIKFGSWVEQNIVANGLTGNLASGASLGGPGRIKTRTKSNIGGSYFNTNGFHSCIISPLTMPNNNCNNETHFADGSKNSMNIPQDKQELIARFMQNDGSGDFELHRDCRMTGAPSFESYKTHVYKCNNNFVIDGNIEALNANYATLTEIPKIIIYTDKNINIACWVDRIDAVLIAEGNINTCSGGGGTNSGDRSRQLKINGSVIANKLVAGRTFGAGTGSDGSGTPAEIINYDTSLYLWGASKNDILKSGKITTTYQAELAPRY